jgi:hypothetical protein
MLVAFSTAVRLEKVHPLQIGVFRLKHPLERRPEMRKESAWLFWPRFVAQTFVKYGVRAGVIIRLVCVANFISRNPATKRYSDPSLTLGVDDDEEKLDLFNNTTGGRAAFAFKRKFDRLTRASRAA